MLNRTRDNLVASAVDIASVVFAYNLGIAQLGLGAGLAYAVFDAWLVVWQRDRISGAIHSLANSVRRTGVFRRKDSLPWASD